MAFQSQTYANSNTAYYGNPADWSNYSTINDTIRFNDTNATLEVFPAVPDNDTTISFNGNQLAYVSDIPDLANWAQYPANHDVDVPIPFNINVLQGSVNADVLNVNTINLATVIDAPAGTANIQTGNFEDVNVTSTITAPLLQNTSVTIFADQPNILGPNPEVNIQAIGGSSGGNISLYSYGGVAGVGGGGTVSMTAAGGSGLLGYNGTVNITANPGSSAVLGVTTGGLINITANSGINDAINLTSAVKVSGAGINIQSGITSPITSVAGYTFIGGNSGVNICGGIPPIIPNVPGTTYIYGTTGIELNSDVYTTRVYPYWSGATPVVDDLLISGRLAGVFNNAAYLNLELVSSISGPNINISGVNTINGSVYPPVVASIPPDLQLSTITMNPTGNINVSTITGVSTINGVAYPEFKPIASGDLNMNNFKILSTNTVNFQTTPSFQGGELGIRSAPVNIGSGFPILECYDPSSVTQPPIIRPFRTTALHLSYGTNSTPPTTYDNDLYLYNETATGRVGVNQYTTGGISTFTVALLTDPKADFDLYVSPNGTDSFIPDKGSGNILNPFRTINYAITIGRAQLSNTSEVTIHLATGTYSESFTVTRNTYIVGNSTGEQNQPCNIIGTITMNDTAGQMGLSGLQITPSSTDGVIISGAGGIYSIYNCNIIGGTSNSIEVQQGTVFITECRIISNNLTGAVNPAIAIQSGATVTIRDCTISNQVLNPSSVITCNGTLTLRQSIIQSLNTASTTLLPLINFGGSANKVIEISNCNLTYANILTDTGGNKCCILFSNSGGTYTVSISQCLLLCEGAVTGSGGQIQCIQDTNAGAVVMAYGGLLAGATAHHISPNVTKTAYTPVP